MTETAAGTTPASSPFLLEQSRLIDLISQGPTLNQVASTLLQQALGKHYAHLQIDPDHTMLATPVWRDDEQGFAIESFRFESLTHALIRQSVEKTRANLIEGEHFLTVTPDAQPATHLAVDMDELTSLLNEHAAFFFIAFAQQQLDYWNGTGAHRPRWQELSDTLKTAVDVQSAVGWDADACALGQWVANHPEKPMRQSTLNGFSQIRACLLDIDLVEGSNTTHLTIAGAIVLTATVKQRERFLMYTIGAGHESFSSLAELGESLPGRLDLDLSGRSLEWRLVEPQENIFDSCTWALVNIQLDDIKALDPANRPVVPTALSSPSHNRHLSGRDHARLSQLNRAIPKWLYTGSIRDFQAYTRYIVELGRLHKEEPSDNVGQPLLSIKSYAQQQMREAIVADKAAEDAASLPLDDLQITVTHSFEVAGLTLPNPLEQEHQTLGEFALENTTPYLASVAFTNGHGVPAWLTVDYLTQMAEQVDIGGHYPALIKKALIDDPQQAARHRARYRRQLPTLLPLLALECKLRHRGDVDERGYTYICQLMASISAGQSDTEPGVYIRPLAFRPRFRLSNVTDTVANTFIIGPREPELGPCLLYRPLSDTPLRQFASPQNLLYAIYQPGELRDSVLAWLASPSLSFEYAQFVFSSGIPSPWIIPRMAFEPFIHFDLIGPIGLDDTPLTGDILDALHTANSQALAELADRQSVSNSERRRALLANSGWAVFSIASNFMVGAAGTAVWVWQTIEQIQQAIDAREQGDTLVEWRSVGDILLTLGIILTQHIATLRSRTPLALFETSAEQTLEEMPAVSGAFPPTPPTIRFNANAMTDVIAPNHLSSVEPGTLVRPSTSAGFTAMLERFQIPEPDLDGHSISPVSHLYTLGDRLCARVGARWFQVTAPDNEPVCIVDPADPSHTGLAIKFDDTLGEWHWDPKLRLRGGSPTGRIEALRRAKAQNKEKAWTALHQFMAQEVTRKNAVSSALLELPRDGSSSEFEPRAQRYLALAEALGDEYTQALGHLETWRQSGGGGVFYQSQLMRLTAEQHRCLGGALRLQMRVYAQMTEKFANSASTDISLSRDEQIDITTRATALSDQMIARRQVLRQSLDTLGQLAGISSKVGHDLERLLPAFTDLDLKANEISMAYEWCVREQPGPAMEDAREAVNLITGNASTASHDLIELTRAEPVAGGQRQRIEQLARLNDRFASLAQEIEQLPAAHPGLFVQARLDRIHELIGEFHALAGARLVAELPERTEQPVVSVSQPGPSTSRPRVKVSKSRPRQGASESSRESEESGAIREIPFIKLSRSRLPKKSDAVDVIARALELNLKINEFNRTTREDAKRPGRIPADIRDMFEQQSVRLTQTASDVDAALAAQQRAGRPPLPVASLSQELRNGAQRTRTEGISTYAAMLKQRKPREAYFHWLYDNGLVEVVKDERGRIRTRQRGDYFQEYRILDKARNNEPLWVAHFHYDALKDPDAKYTTAHLKPAEPYLQTLDAATRQSLSTFDAVENALRKIVDPVVRDLFLKPQPRDPVDD